MGKYFFFAIAGVVVLGGIWFLGRPAAAPDPSAIIRGNEVKLEVVKTPEEQQKGLSGRTSLAEQAGMLFLYEKPAIPGFWMPDMHFAIDIIWIDSRKRIAGITAGITPETYPEIFRPPAPIQYVLEVNAGWAEKYGVKPGDSVELHDVF
jgi:uncharacterized protein